MLPLDPSSALDSWMAGLCQGFLNRCLLIYGPRLPIPAGCRVGALPSWPLPNKWGGVCVGGSTPTPLILLPMRPYGLNRETPPTDPDTIECLRRLLIHEIAHAGQSRESQAHGREFGDRCRLLARIFHLPEPGPRVPLRSWPAYREPIAASEPRPDMAAQKLERTLAAVRKKLAANDPRQARLLSEIDAYLRPLSITPTTTKNRTNPRRNLAAKS